MSSMFTLEEWKYADPVRLRTCYHEAGHALVAQLMRGVAGSRQVTTTTSRREVFMGELSAATGTTRYTDEPAVLQGIMSSLAGAAAVQLADLDHTPIEEDSTEDLLKAVLAVHVELAKHTDDDEVRRSAAGALLALLARWVDWLLDRHRDALDAIALALLEQGTLTGGQLDELIETFRPKT